MKRYLKKDKTAHERVFKRDWQAEEDYIFTESILKEAYYDKKEHMLNFIKVLNKLDIPIHGDEYYFDIEEQFVERLIPAPTGWQWWRETIERI